MRLPRVGEEEDHYGWTTDSFDKSDQIIGRGGKEDRFKEIKNPLDASWTGGSFQ